MKTNQIEAVKLGLYAESDLIANLYRFTRHRIVPGRVDVRRGMYVGRFNGARRSIAMRRSVHSFAITTHVLKPTVHAQRRKR